MRKLRHRSSASHAQVTGGAHVIDRNKSIYHIWEPGQFTHKTKLRPFCAEFLMKAMEDFEVHFNTAATRTYGSRVIQVLKMEIEAKVRQN